MRIIGSRWLLAALLTLPIAGPVAARAQDAALDDKLRDLLRQTTEQLRAAQDSAATAQAALDSMTKQRDALQAQLAAAEAKPAGPSPQQQAEMAQAAAQAKQAQAQAAAMQADYARLQSQYAAAATLARQKDLSDRANADSFKKASAQLGVCKAENTRLIDTAEEILHLYQTPKFNSLLIANHDRLIGFARVKLENLVQDYDDKIQAQSYIDPAAGH